MVIHRFLTPHTIRRFLRILPGMRRLTEEVLDLVDRQGGVIGRRQQPELAASMDGLLRTGRLTALLPGVYARPGLEHDPRAWMWASQLWDVDSVLTLEAAASLTFWPTLPVRVVAVASSRRLRRAMLRSSTRRIDPDFVVVRQGLRCTSPALTAVDLAGQWGGDAIDAALRSRQVTLGRLHEALAAHPDRAGNAVRRLLLHESRSNPWSPLERRAHRVLRTAGITGWTGNYPLVLAGRTLWLDIAFPRQRLVIEIDGREFHEGAEVFEADRWRQNALVAAGWRVLRFTARMIDDTPHLVVLAILDELAR